MGGYSSFPICIVASILKIKFIIYENNLIVGKANKCLLPFAKKEILVACKDLEELKKNKDKMIEIGNLIREEIININTNFILNKDYSILNILILGGSQGARIFAEKIPQELKKIKDQGYPLKFFSNVKSIKQKHYPAFTKGKI